MTYKEERNIETFFIQHPESLVLFIMIRNFIKSLGPVTIQIQKTQISFSSGTKFAWVWLPQTWVKRPENSITLSFTLKRWIEHELITDVFGPRYGRWMHRILITKDSEFEETKNWVWEAYFECLRR